MSKSSAAHWVKFFNASGIPSPAAASYAHIFVENRIQSDMIMDLNKEYLREMGITPMGDIIAILRHAKTVSDQYAREKVLGTESHIPVAAVLPATPKQKEDIKSLKISLKSSSAGSNNTNLKRTASSVAAATVISTAPKPARRVLPEHEGKYKIHLPTGCTERSKEILAKREKLYSDRVSSTKKSDVFSRLSASQQQHQQKALPSSSVDCVVDDSESLVSSSVRNDTNNIRVQITGIGDHAIKRTNSSSVFARLGGKSTETIVAKQIKPILKNAQKSGSASTVAIGGVTKAKHIVSPTIVRTQQQKVMLVKKVPLKSGDDSEDDSYSDYMDDMDCDTSPSVEKFVKFATTAEVREIAPISNYKREKQNIKSRLGIVSKLHATKKTYNLKASPPGKTRTSPVKGKTIRMKSDEMLSRQEMPVHQRLGNNNKKSKDNRNDSNLKEQRRYSVATASNVNRKSNATSVFDRLGI